jgi:hypothetical protein
MSIYTEKADQAAALLHEFDLDCWLTFARESVVSPDPGIELAIGSNVTWPSAFIFTKDGQRIAIVGRYDVPGVESYGVFPTIISYTCCVYSEYIWKCPWWISPIFYIFIS